jgi:hypothetical protein
MSHFGGSLSWWPHLNAPTVQILCKFVLIWFEFGMISVELLCLFACSLFCSCASSRLIRRRVLVCPQLQLVFFDFSARHCSSSSIFSPCLPQQLIAQGLQLHVVRWQCICSCSSLAWAACSAAFVLIDISSVFLWITTAFQSGFALRKVKFEFHLEQQLSVNSSCSMSISSYSKATPVMHPLVPLFKHSLLALVFHLISWLTWLLCLVISLFFGKSSAL